MLKKTILIAILGIIIAFIDTTTAIAPILEYPGEMAIVQENSLIAVSNAVFSCKTSTETSLNRKDDIIDLIWKKKPEMAELLIKLANCESSLNPSKWNKEDPNGGSKSLFQFSDETFYLYAKWLKIKEPDIWNIEHQLKVAVWLIEGGYGKEYWQICWRKMNLWKY